MNSLKAFACTLLLVACSGDQDSWQRVEAVDGGGFSLLMPQAGDLQAGTLFLGEDTVTSHLNIVADSGITYMSSWFVPPTRFQGISSPAALEALLPLVTRRVEGVVLENEAPPVRIGKDEGLSFWYMTKTDVRMGVVLRAMDSRMVLLSAAIPSGAFGEPSRKNIQRFLGSFSVN